MDSFGWIMTGAFNNSRLLKMEWLLVHHQSADLNEDVEMTIQASWKEYLGNILGILSEHVRATIHAEVIGNLHKELLDKLETHGWNIGGMAFRCGLWYMVLASALVDFKAQLIGIESSRPRTDSSHRRLKANRGFYG